MQKRKLGQQGLEVSALGLGCMGMSWAYGPSNEDESLAVLSLSQTLGINFWDTAELYGPYTNESLLGKALKGGLRDKIIIATKYGFTFNEKGEETGLNSSPQQIKKSIEGSLKRLGTDYIDLYYQHRLDPKTPIEETIGQVAELVREGKVRYIGLSEVGAGSIRRAHTVHPLTAVQTEYSLWERGVEEKVLPILRELGIGLVAYSPLGRGLLTGKIQNLQDLEISDLRRKHPRFHDEHISQNLTLVNYVKQIATEHNATASQIALAWLLRQGTDIVPIPGTRRIQYLKENVAACSLELPDSVWQSLDVTLANFQQAGMRFSAENMKLVDNS